MKRFNHTFSPREKVAEGRMRIPGIRIRRAEIKWDP